MAQVTEKPNDTRFNYKGKILNWKTDMQSLSLDELPFVEYRMENTKIFKKLFLKKPGGLGCTVCNTMAMSGKASVNSHLSGKKHQRAIELVVEFRHNTIKNVGSVKPNANTPGKPAGNVGNTPAKPATGTTAKPQDATPTKPAGSTPVSAKPAGSTPVSAKPSGGTPVAAKPGGSTPVAAKPAGSTPVAAKSAGSTPVAAKTVAGTPVVVVKSEGSNSQAAKPAGTVKPSTAVATAKPGTATPVKAAGAAKPVGTPAPKALGPPKAKPAGTPATKPPGTPATKPPGTPAAKPAGTTPTAKPAGTPTAKPPGTPAAKPPGTPQGKPVPKPPEEVTKPAVKTVPKVVGKPGSTTPAKPVASGAVTKPAGTPNQTAKATPAKMPAAKAPAAVTSGIAKPTGTATPTNTPAKVAGTATPKPKSTSTAVNSSSSEIKMETTAADASLQEKSAIKDENVNFADDVIITNLSEPEVVDLVSDNEEPESPVKPKATTDTVTSNGKPAPVIDDDGKECDVPLAIKQMKTLRSVMHSLGPSDLQLIEYRFITGNWMKLITRDFKSNFACRLCKKFNMPTVTMLNAHIAEDSHKKSMGAVRGVYHPIIAPVKLPVKFLSELTPEPPEVQTEVAAETSKESNEKDYKFTKPVSLLEFKSKHVYLDIEELLKIEYREKSSIWYSLVCKQGTTYKCALCKTPYLGAIKNIMEHLRGKKHLTVASTLTELHHPKYCPASGRPVDITDTEMTDDGGQKSNKVLNPMAVFKNTTNTTAAVSKDNVPQGRKVPTRITQHPVGTPAPKRQPIATHPGLQPQLPTNQPSFAAKTITSKPETDDKLEGYIGVEYVVKILENAQDSNPRFECSLCELETNGDGMQAHLKSSAHRLKYLDRHFRTCMRDFEQYRKDLSCRNMIAEIARRISVAVEKHHGRDLPFECLKDEYRLNRPEIMSKVFSFRHASEYSGPSMIHVIDKSTLNEMYNNRHKIPAQIAPENKRRTTFDAEDGTSAKRYRMDANVENKKPQAAKPLDVDEHRRLVDQFLRSTNRDGLMDRRQRRSRSRGRERHGRGRRSRSRSMGRRRSRSRSGDAWSTYRHLFDHAIRDLETDYKRYERDPETHPLYQKEWKIFWQKRSEELATDGRDPTSYDFQPEWILFWTRRMDQIHEEEIDTLKRKLRDRLNLPYHNHELRDERYHIGNQRKPQSAFSQIRQSIDTKGNVPPGNMEPSGEGPRGYNDMRFDMNPMDQMPSGMGLGPGPFEMQQPNMGPGPFNMPPQNMGPGPFNNMPSQNFGPFNMDSFGMSQNMNVPIDGMMQPFPIQQQNMMPHRMGGGDLRPINTNLTDIMPKQNMPSSVMGNTNMNPTRRSEKQVVDNRNLRQLSGNQAQQPGRLNENPKPPGNFAANVAARKPEPSVQKQQQQQPSAHENIRDNSRQKEQQEQKKKPSQRERSPPDDDEPIDSGPLNIVSVLRLLTALEDNLGILGPRVIDLMARALQLEKSNLGSADRILLTQENTVFLETVREKLRGQIVVGVLDASKTRAVNQAIKDVTTLLNKGILNDGRTPIIEKVHVSKSISSIVPKPPQISASISNNAAEKRELASKLAAALAAQGKTNVTSDQLEQLIAVYTLIEKKQRENEPKQQSLSDLLVDSLKVSSSFSTEDNRNIGINNNDNFSGSRQDNNYFAEQQSRSSSSQQQKQFDRISEFSNPNNQNVSQGRSMNMGSFNRNETNQFSGSGSSNQFSGSGSSNQPSWKSSSYSFGLSNFDTSLSLPSINIGYNRNSDSNRQNQQQQEEMQQNNMQNTPVYMTNIGRTNRNNDTQQQQKDMVSYPSLWQRSGTIPGRMQPIASQKMPLGWQQNQNNSNNRNRGRR